MLAYDQEFSLRDGITDEFSALLFFLYHCFSMNIDDF